jgi:hypothetical protein
VDAEVAGHGRGDAQKADQRAGHQQDDRDPACMAGGDLGPEAASDLELLTE